MFKTNNKDTRTISEIFRKLTIKNTRTTSMFVSYYKNQSTDLHSKSVDWFLDDRNINVVLMVSANFLILP